MKETKTAKKPEAPTGKFSKPITAQKAKRHRATSRMIVRLIGCLTALLSVYLVQITGDMSNRLALLLIGACLAVGAYHLGAWIQYMWPKEG